MATGRRMAAVVASLAAIVLLRPPQSTAEQRHGRVSSMHSDDYRRYDDRASTWSPSSGVICYRNIRQCRVGNNYSGYWTNREFH